MGRTRGSIREVFLDLHAELAHLVRDLEVHLGLLRSFGIQQLPRRSPGPVELVHSSDRPAAGPSREQAQAGLFAPGRPAAPRSAPQRWRPNPLSAEQAGAELDLLRQRLGGCTRCRLHERRQHIVFGEGHPTARLVLVGEGPGGEEDRCGRPFVGPAGQLLDRILAAMGVQRSEVYICNVVKCRPPGNRTPEPDEMRTCGVFLARQLEIIRPRYIICLGATAAQYLLGTERSLGRLRGRLYDMPDGSRLLPTYHPAYLLRNEAAKKPVWQDVQLVMAEMARAAEEET
ncbi:MAG: uracil-DNA glycosylase [Deltaproteobacteria bacterium]|nr:uracil-DNA glycosylase [Deltaproteobacteria bacterium]